MPTEPAMALLNRAYGVLRHPDQRKAYDASRAAARSVVGHRSMAAGPGRAGEPPARDTKGTPVTFGRYQGWTLEQLARHDPEYLEWLKRHSSGIGYRRQIEEILAAKRATAAPQPTPARRR